MKYNNKKKLKLSLNKMRIAALGNTAIIKGGETAVTCPTDTDTDVSVDRRNCGSDPTILTRTNQDASDVTL